MKQNQRLVLYYTTCNYIFFFASPEVRFSPLLCHLYNTVSSSTPPSVSCFPFIYFSVILLPHPDVFPISVFSFRWGNPYIAMGKTPGQWAILLAFLVRGARGGFEASCKMDWMHLFKGFPLDTCLDWRNGFAIHGNESRRKWHSVLYKPTDQAENLCG